MDAAGHAHNSLKTSVVEHEPSAVRACLRCRISRQNSESAARFASAATDIEYLELKTEVSCVEGDAGAALAAEERIADVVARVGRSIWRFYLGLRSILDHH